MVSYLFPSPTLPVFIFFRRLLAPDVATSLARRPPPERLAAFAVIVVFAVVVNFVVPARPPRRRAGQSRGRACQAPSPTRPLRRRAARCPSLGRAYGSSRRRRSRSRSRGRGGRIRIVVGPPAVGFGSSGGDDASRRRAARPIRVVPRDHLPLLDRRRPAHPVHARGRHLPARR